MFRIILTFLFYISYNFCTAQTFPISISKRTNKYNPHTFPNLKHIHPKTDIELYEFVDSLQFSTKINEKKFEDLYEQMALKARSIGANSYQFISYQEKKDSNLAILKVNVFFANDSIVTINSNHNPKNVVYIFGKNDSSNQKQNRFKLEEKEITFNAGNYYKINLQMGQPLTINKGGIAGMTMVLKYEKSKPATFLSMEGIKFNMGENANVLIDGIGVDFNAGRFYPMNNGFGYLLLDILQESK